MHISESLKIAIKSIKANKMRTLLTMLGIIIGISSVIMIVGAGTGARDYIVSMIEEMGSNAVMVSVDATSATDSDYITLEDCDNIKSKVNSVDYVSPLMIGFANATIDSQETEATAVIIGVSSDIQYSMSEACAYGRFLTDEEYQTSSPVAIIGTNSADMAYGYEDVVGEYITVSSSGGTMKVKIIGVADIDSMVSSLGSSSSISDMMSINSETLTIALFMPCTTLAELSGEDVQLSSIFVIGEDESNNEAIGNATVNYLKAAHGNYSSTMYSAEDMATYVELVDTIMSILTGFIAAIGAISLLVGGIGVMNIMLVSVTERTREIGIRKALGAKTGVITTQFLTESIIICLIGGVIGVVIGILGAYGVCSLLGIEATVTVGTVLIALGFSTVVGLVFGVYPARKAAKMSPIDALRRE